MLVYIEIYDDTKLETVIELTKNELLKHGFEVSDETICPEDKAVEYKVNYSFEYVGEVEKTLENVLNSNGILSTYEVTES